MNLLMINDGGYLIAILLGLFIMFAIPVILFIIGLALRNKNKKASKTLLIIAAIYVLIGLGICGSMMV
jgi:hypothetical protein